MNKINKIIFIAGGVLIVLFLVLAVLSIKQKSKKEKIETKTGTIKEETMEKIIEDLTAPTSTDSAVSKEVLETLSAPPSSSFQSQQQEEILKSLSAPK